MTYKSQAEVLSGIHFGDHVCSIYQNREQQFSVVVPFLIEGLKSNQKCIYVVDGSSKKEIISEFKKVGFEVEKFLKSGQMEIINFDKVYLRNGRFETEKIMERIEEIEKKAFEDGYWGIKGTAEMTWLQKGGFVEDDIFIDYESQLNEFLVGRKISLICQYEENKFSQKILNNIIRTHPFTIIYGKLYENKYFYTSPEYMEGGASVLPDDAYKTIIDMIRTE